MDPRAPVVVLDRGGPGALSIARTLGHLGVPMYLVSHEGRGTPVWASRYWRKRIRRDFSEPIEPFLLFLLDLGREIESEHGARPLLLTSADWPAILIEENADLLTKQFVFPRAERPIIRGLANKSELFSLAVANGVPTPATSYPRSRDDVAAFLEFAQFPVVLKAADAYLPYVPEKAILHTADEVLEKCERDAARGPYNVILQEYIPGDAESVWMCNAYFGAESKCLAIFTGKKLRQVSSTGVASLAVCLPNETVANQTRALMQGVGYQGCVGIGWRYDARDGLYKVLDVNPRISGVFRLFRATNGIDVVQVCYLDLTGQPVPTTALTIGRKWLLEEDVLVAMGAVLKGNLSLNQLRQSWRGVQEVQWFKRDDPAPLFAWLWRGLRRKTLRWPRRKRDALALSRRP
jgi:D-aspartate ligase